MSENFQIEYRQACEADIDQLVELRIKQLIDEGYPEIRDIHKDLKQYFSASLENGSLICWIGSLNDVIVATAGICFYQLPPTFSNPSGRIAYITNMFTESEHRGRGVASHLVKLLMEKAKALNYASIRLHASSHGKRIYESAGFTDDDGFMSKRL